MFILQLVTSYTQIGEYYIYRLAFIRVLQVACGLVVLLDYCHATKYVINIYIKMKFICSTSEMGN